MASEPPGPPILASIERRLGRRAEHSAAITAGLVEVMREAFGAAREDVMRAGLAELAVQMGGAS